MPDVYTWLLNVLRHNALFESLPPFPRMIEVLADIMREDRYPNSGIAHLNDLLALPQYPFSDVPALRSPPNQEAGGGIPSVQQA